MKCISCEVEINPKWKHAVEINVCPFCGQHIMEEHLKNLLAALAETMNKLQEYPDQLNDWLLSNYNYIKTDSPSLPDYLSKDFVKQLKKEEEERDFQERKKFTVKVKTEAGEEDVEAETLQSEDRTNKFFERAEVIKRGSSDREKDKGPKEFKSPTEKTEYLKRIKKQIEEGGGSPGIIKEDGLNSMITPEEMELISSGDLVASSLPGALDEEDHLANRILNANLAIAKQTGKGSGPNQQDLRALHDMYARVEESRKKFESGEARETKGGFSRRS